MNMNNTLYKYTGIYTRIYYRVKFKKLKNHTHQQ